MPYLSNPVGYILTELIGVLKVLNQLRQETQDIQRKSWSREDAMGMAEYGAFELLTVGKHITYFILRPCKHSLLKQL